MAAKKAGAKKAAKKAVAKKVATKKAVAKKASKRTAPSKRLLSDLETRFEKSFGPDRLITSHEFPRPDFISTGSIELDDKLGGGWALGRLIEIWGPQGGGKSSLALTGSASFQRNDPRNVAYIDVEHTYDPEWAKKMGVDLDRLHIVVPDTAQSVANAVKMLVDSEVFSLVVIDSVGAMFGAAEQEKDAEDAVVAEVAKVVTRAVKLGAEACARNECTVMLINQVRANIGGYGAASTHSSGGYALGHATSQKVKVGRKDAFNAPMLGEVGQVYCGHEMSIRVERNKLADPQRVAVVNLMTRNTPEYGPIGIDRVAEAFLVGQREHVGIIVRSGAWYSFVEPSDTPISVIKIDGEFKAFDAETGEDRTLYYRSNGKEEMIDYLRQNPEAVDRIVDRLKQVQSQAV